MGIVVFTLMPAPYGSCCTILLYFFKVLCCKIKNVFLGFPGGIVIKNLPCNAGDTALIPDFPQTVKCLPTVRETWVQSLGLIPGSGRSSGEGKGNPLQYSCLENPMDGGA